MELILNGYFRPQVSIIQPKNGATGISCEEFTRLEKGSSSNGFRIRRGVVASNARSGDKDLGRPKQIWRRKLRRERLHGTLA
jgi:hypothetical protein